LQEVYCISRQFNRFVQREDAGVWVVVTKTTALIVLKAREQYFIGSVHE